MTASHVHWQGATNVGASGSEHRGLSPLGDPDVRTVQARANGPGSAHHAWSFPRTDGSESMNEERMDMVLERLGRIEATLAELAGRPAAKDWYTTSEVAEALKKAEYTVREWCRKGQVKARKSPNGREW